MHTEILSLSVGCSGITLLKLMGSQDNRIPKPSAALIVIAFTIGMCLIIFDCEFRYSIVRPRMIREWNTIGDSESKNDKAPTATPDSASNEGTCEAEEKKDSRKRLINIIGITVIAVCIVISLYLIVTNSNDVNKAEITSEYSTESSTTSNTAQSAAFETSNGSTEISAKEVTISQ